MNFICIFPLINRWFNILNIINPLENNMKTISCWFNNIAIRKKNEMKIIVINLRLFDLPEWKSRKLNIPSTWLELGFILWITCFAKWRISCSNKFDCVEAIFGFSILITNSVLMFFIRSKNPWKELLFLPSTIFFKSIPAEILWFLLL